MTESINAHLFVKWRVKDSTHAKCDLLFSVLHLCTLRDHLTQATGPPRSGAGVGFGILKGICGFLGIPKIQKNDWPKRQRFHADPTLWGNGRYFLKNIFVTYGSELFTHIQDLRRFHHRIL